MIDATGVAVLAITLMPRLEFSDHALEGIAARRLERAWVERVALEPEWTRPSRRRPESTLRFGRIRDAGGKVLRVVTVDEGDVRAVLTAHFDRTAREPGR